MINYYNTTRYIIKYKITSIFLRLINSKVKKGKKLYNGETKTASPWKINLL